MPRKRRYGIIILGQRHYCDAQVDCYIELLKAFHARDNGFLATLAQHKRRKLRLVARRLEDLHEDHVRRPDFVNRHAQRILDGWWVWRCLSQERVLKNIEYACAYAGAEWGKDVVVDWASRGIDTSWSEELLTSLRSLGHSGQ